MKTKNERHIFFFLCRNHLSFAVYDYKDKYHPFGIDLGFFGIRIQIKKPTMIEELK